MWPFNAGRQKIYGDLCKVLGIQEAILQRLSLMETEFRQLEAKVDLFADKAEKANIDSGKIKALEVRLDKVVRELMVYREERAEADRKDEAA